MTDVRPPWEEPISDDLHPAKIEKPEDIKAFLLAGHADIKLVSVKSKSSRTYLVKTVPDATGDVTHFVSVLVRPGERRSHTYLGIVLQYARYKHGTKKSEIAIDASENKAFDWFWQLVIEQQKTPAELGLEVWHAGRCGACGRKLTDPEAIAKGIGPECSR